MIDWVVDSATAPSITAPGATISDVKTANGLTNSFYSALVNVTTTTVVNLIAA